MNDRPPVNLPPGAMPDDYRFILDLFQILFHGETSEDVVRRRGCIQCDASKITDRDFRTPQHIRYYFLIGMCQECQDKMCEWLNELRKEGVHD